MSRSIESEAVEEPLVRLLEGRGWVHAPADGLGRDSDEEPLAVRELAARLKSINAAKDVGDEEVGAVLRELKLASSGPEGCKKILQYLKFGVPVKCARDRTVHFLQLLDHEKTGNNSFTVTQQARYQGAKENIRTDIMLYVNGIPLVNIECKNPASFTEDWRAAYKDVKFYEQHVPELYKYVQLGVAAEQIAYYFPIVPWIKEVKVHQWKEPREPGDEIKPEDEARRSLDDLAAMLAPQTLLDIIRNFLFYREERGEATKVVARYMQYHAAKKIVDRVIGNLEGRDNNRKGLIWHWQGSGKTLTMIFAGHKLYFHPKLENPSIFFMVDRMDLEDQFASEFAAMDIARPETVESVADLKSILLHDGGRGKRGLFVTLIHKFRPDELDAARKELENLSETQQTVMTRKNIIAFVDEGHRSQYGTMAAMRNSLLKNAFLFAFTGTPVSKKDRDTYHEFSPEGERYLDRYFITSALGDGFTKKIVYQPRLEREWHLRKDMLEAFLAAEYEELPDLERDDVESDVKRRLNPINMFLENEERINMVAADIAVHFKENVDGRFKAMVVACNRRACVRYKRALDKHLPSEYSDVVMTYVRKKDPKIISDYHHSIESAHPGMDDSEINREIKENYTDRDMPRIIIVTDMLLTGFDAPILQTMYLDKPLKEHRLLQAIARTNRPFKNLKQAGVIIDYVGILRNFQKAFELYSKDECDGVLFDMDQIREAFARDLKRTLGMFEGITIGDYGRDALLGASERLTTDEDLGKLFVEEYRDLRKTFELLGSDPGKIEHLKEYKWLTAVYIFYMRTVQKEKPDREHDVGRFFARTLDLIHKTTELEKIDQDLPFIEFDEQYMKQLEEKVKSREEKAANIVFTLHKFALTIKGENPLYESILDKVERLMDEWRQKNRDYAVIYANGSSIVNDIEQLKARQKALGFTDLEYAILQALEGAFLKDDSLPSDVRSLSDALSQCTFPGWFDQATAKKDVERTVRTFLRRYMKEHGAEPAIIDNLWKVILDRVAIYGREGVPGRR